MSLPSGSYNLMRREANHKVTNTLWQGPKQTNKKIMLDENADGQTTDLVEA